MNHEQESPYLNGRGVCQLLIVQSLAVGLMTGSLWIIFASAIKWLIGSRRELILSLENRGVQVLVAGTISALLVVAAFTLCKRFAPEALGGGIAYTDRVLKGNSIEHPLKIIGVKFLGSLAVLGSGMTLGPEGPIIQMGGASGTLISRLFRVSGEKEKILTAAGAGAAMGAAFNAPLGGILYVLEEFKPEFADRLTAWRSVTVAVVVATAAARYVAGPASVFSLTKFPTPPLSAMWIFIILGILLGFAGYWFNKLYFLCSDRWRWSTGKVAVLGFSIGILTLFAPLLTGDGADTILWTFTGREAGWMILAVFCGRFLLTIVSSASGVPGGLYTPLLGLATIFSLGFARELELGLPGILPHPAILGIAGMAALVSAVAQTPLTALIITLEITDNYELILSMIVCCLTASVTAGLLGGRSLYRGNDKEGD